MIVSCVILNYNDSATTSTLVKSIENYRLLDKIIVVDNLSTDDSYECLKRLESDKVIVIQSNRNGGYGYGNNFGVKYAKERFNSDYVLICNPDVMFQEKVVSSALKVVQNDPSIAIVSPIQLKANGEKANTIAWRVPSALKYIMCSGVILKRIVKGYKYEDSELNDGINYVDCIPGSFLFVNTEAFAKVGGYDENIFLYCEETVLGIKMKEAGYKTALDGSETYYHLHSVSINKSFSKEVQRTRLLLKSRRYVIKRYLGGNKFEMALADVIFLILLFETRIKTMG